MRILVTGGTGTLGTRLVPRLRDAGHDVVVLSRGRGPGTVVGDVRSAADVQRAAGNAEVIVHAATSPRRARSVDLPGTRHVVAAAQDVGAQVVYLSITGVDRVRIPYYRVKLAAEQVVMQASSPWTILRATQFHDLVEQVLRLPVSVRTASLRFQPVAPDDVARRIVDLIAAGPTRTVELFGGPEVLSMTELEHTRHEVTGKRTRLARVPAIGPLRDLDAGKHLVPDHLEGRVTWRSWLHG